MTAELSPDIVLKVDNLSTSFVFKRRTVPALRDVTFTLREGKTLALVGESGSGKSVTSLSILRLLSSPGQIVGGSILYRTRAGQILDLAKAEARTMRRVRGGEISMIFQEPMSSLNPLMRVGDQIGEMLTLHLGLKGQALQTRVRELLELVEIPAAARRMWDYPHSMSGGMRQRVMIALALACNPRLLIADEPTTALDVTIQAQILRLMQRLQRDLGMSILFITHDMGVVAEMADEVAVMYAGEVVEQGAVRPLFAKPSHPYTTGLLASIPSASRGFAADGSRLPLTAIPGSVPSPMDLPVGCTFAPRCAGSEAACREPARLAALGADHMTRCWKMRQSA
ncbi:ABC transporter ATP-binding protein [Pannonibacter sp. SL95]|jgi:peptide/nickel transport system ATP-binding protein|uniref:ABC transporter ATP-binding protein n=1 Tax=Pannonibacter sp. SL95 TaxID=2995153 RepID=UPI00227608D0|nr:ABC transporter ATP-binding protein [Pannonibacter sp. SL95]MCY1708299.1 ABC transporter ATP-binding protein [Pannonibacter sp. SL95]